MSKNQIFKKMIPKELLNEIISAFGLRSLDDKRNFSRKDLITLNTVDIINNIKDKLVKYYLPCKARTYLNDLNEKNVITILRQCIKPFNYTVCSREKYLKGEKFIIYNIVPSSLKNYVSVVGPFEVTKEYRLLTFD